MALRSRRDIGKLRRRLRKGSVLRLHVGCGSVRLPGWVNIDITPDIRPDVVWDMTNRMPLPSGCVSHVFSEHFLEHLGPESGLKTLREFHRLMRPGGVVRVAMPDLESIAKAYLGGWRSQVWVQQPEYGFIQTRAEMFNVAMRWWGHQWVYDEDEARRRLAEAGFKDIERCMLGKSNHAELQSLETRPDSLLILEARR